MSQFRGRREAPIGYRTPFGLSGIGRPSGYRVSDIGYGREATTSQFRGRRGAPTGRPEGLQFRG